MSGAGGSGGYTHQHAVGAWLLVNGLAGEASQLPWDLSDSCHIEYVGCERFLPVDDVVARTSNGGFIFIQSKKGLRLETAITSELGKALSQFVELYHSANVAGMLPKPWDRPLETNRDRLILVVDAGTSGGVRTDFQRMLRGIRGLDDGEPLESACINKGEQKAWSVTKRQIRDAWKKRKQNYPTQMELRSFLELVYVQELNFGSGEANELEAKNLLRQAVISKRPTASVTWDRLNGLVAQRSKERSGVSVAGARDYLGKGGLSLLAPKSMALDIERLKSHAVRQVQLLGELARITIGGTGYGISRDVDSVLAREAERGHLLLVGDPGAGKSGCLHGLAAGLINADRDVVYLSADRIDGIAASSLIRQELGLKADLEDVLESWPGTAPGILIIDGLDGARSANSARAIKDLLSWTNTSGSRWIVIASIRRFDLRNSQTYQQYFRGQPVDGFAAPDFAQLRHLNIPVLTESELIFGVAGIPALTTLLAAASPEFRRLLCSPFNLRLVAEMMDMGLNPEVLGPLRTQTGLLERYWSARVNRDGAPGQAREEVLAKVCSSMVTRRSLSISRPVGLPIAALEVLRGLLADHVLQEWAQRQDAPADLVRISFPHNLLFDYAAARLLVPDDASTILEWLGREPDVLLFLRPSLAMRLNRLWEFSRADFWDLAFRLAAKETRPTIAKTIGAAVLANLALTLGELEPLEHEIAAAGDDWSGPGVTLFGHLLGVLIPAQKGLPGRLFEEPWPAFVERLASDLSDLRASLLVRYLWASMVHRGLGGKPAEWKRINRTAQLVLHYCFNRTPFPSNWAETCTWVLGRTFSDDPPGSEAALRPLLNPALVAEAGHVYLHRLATEVDTIAEFVPDLSRDIYIASFSDPDTSKTSMPMGDSQLLSLTTTRSQNYDMALYLLAKKFPNFILVAPSHALSALISVLEAHCTSSGRRPARKISPITAHTLDGSQVQLLEDYSYIWDDGGLNGHDQELEMARHFESYLRKLVVQADSLQSLRNIVEQVRRNNRISAIWRRLFAVGADHPERLGRLLWQVAGSKTFLRCSDTMAASGDLLRAVYPILEPEARRQIEKNLVTLETEWEPDSKESGIEFKLRLLAHLPEALLVSDEAKVLIAGGVGIRKQGGLPRASRKETYSRAVTEETVLSEKGVAVNDPVNKRLRTLAAPLEQFARAHLNDEPSAKEVYAVLSRLTALAKALGQKDLKKAHPLQIEAAYGHMLDAAATAAKCRNLRRGSLSVNTVRKLLMSASKDFSRRKRGGSEREDHLYTRHPRGIAFSGLLSLSMTPIHTTLAQLRAIRRLAGDPSGEVRYRGAMHLNALLESSPATGWELLEKIVGKEKNRGVLATAIHHSAPYIGRTDLERFNRLLTRLTRRLQNGKDFDKIREDCACLLTDLAIVQDIRGSRSKLTDLMKASIVLGRPCIQVLGRIRPLLTVGATVAPSATDARVRKEAIAFCLEMLNIAYPRYVRLETAAAKKKWKISEEEREKLRSLRFFVEAIGGEVYYGSGVSAKGQHKVGDLVPIESMERFYVEASPLIDALARIAIPQVTQHLLETLEYFIDQDPKGTLLRISGAIVAGVERRYQAESQGMELLVAIVHRFVADHRELLADDQECRLALLRVVDIFVEAGWPAAYSLVYELDDVYR